MKKKGRASEEYFAPHAANSNNSHCPHENGRRQPITPGLSFANYFGAHIRIYIIYKYMYMDGEINAGKKSHFALVQCMRHNDMRGHISRIDRGDFHGD